MANIRCNEIKEDQLRAFASDQAWTSLQVEASKGLVPGFGPLLAGLVDSCVKG